MKTRNGDPAGITRTGNIERKGDRINEDHGTEIMARRRQENVIRADSQDTGAGSANCTQTKELGTTAATKPGKTNSASWGRGETGEELLT